MNAGKDPRAQDAFRFGWELAKELAIPFTQARSINGLNVATQQKIQTALGKPMTSTPPPANQQPLPSKYEGSLQRHCVDSKKDITGPGQRKRKNNLPGLKNQCQRCG